MPARRIHPVFPALLLLALLWGPAQAMENECRMPQGFETEALGDEQLTQLHRLANHLLSGKRFSREQFEGNRPAIEATAFAVQAILVCEKASQGVIALAKDPRLSALNVAQLLAKVQREPKKMGAACLATARLKTKTCLEMALIE